MEFLRQLFGSGHFHPHGFCYLWNPGLVWLHAVSDILISLAYFAIPVLLIRFVRKRRDLPFSWMFVLFGVFIVACGMTHLMEVWNLWHANYWLAGAIKAVTAVASVGTAILLLPLLPKVLELPSNTQWIQANARLENEIRERRELELSLRISESIYREQADLLEITHDAILVRDLSGKITYWSRGAERLYGWSKEVARGKISHELLQTRFPASRQDVERAVFLDGSWEGELVHKRQDGTEITVSSRWALRTDVAGTPQAFLESNRDITQRKKEEEKFRNLLESAPDAMVIVNASGEIQLVNAQAEKLFGYARAELLGQNVEILIPHRVRSKHVAHRGDYSRLPRSRGMGAGLELFGCRSDGTEFPVEVSLSPLATAEGTWISSAIRDVTERRQIENEIRKLNVELNKRVVDLRTLNAELESFSYSVSHDLRAPLRHIDGFARILKEEFAGHLPEDGVRYLDRVLYGVNQMGHLVDDLLNLAHIGRKELVLRNTDVNGIVRAAIEGLQNEASGRRVEWHIEPLPHAECDTGLMKLVFSNLLSNALKFTRSRQVSMIEVGTRPIEGVTVFFVRDNGVGFDPQFADKLFGVFQRLHRQEDFEGTGVGLATVQRIIHRHGGNIWAESQLDRGATFYFSLGARVDRQVPREASELKIG